MFDIHDAPFVVEEFMIVEIILDHHLTPSEMDRQRHTSVDGTLIETYIITKKF